jgi:hypothetical protein
MREGAPSSRFLDLARGSKAELVAAMRRGIRPEPGALAGWEYRGLNTATWIRVAGADRFVKGFAHDRGYNRRVGRGQPSDPWLPQNGDEPEPFAFFGVDPVDPESRDNRYLNALLFDYSRYATGPVDPAAPLRDYAVAIDDSCDMLLGHAFAAIRNARLHVTFFVLERLRLAPSEAPG